MSFSSSTIDALEAVLHLQEGRVLHAEALVGETDVDLGEVAALRGLADHALHLARLDGDVFDGGVGLELRRQRFCASERVVEVEVGGELHLHDDVGAIHGRGEVRLDVLGEPHERERRGDRDDEEERLRNGEGDVHRREVEALHRIVAGVPRDEELAEDAVCPAEPAVGLLREDRREGERDEQRDERRDRDGDGERRDELARDGVHRGDGEEHADVREGRSGDGEGDVRGGLLDRLADLVAALHPLERERDVLEDDDGVRDENARRDAEGGHRGDVHRVVEGRERDHRDDHRHGDRHERNEGRAHVGEEEDKDEAREEDALPDRVEAVLHLLIDEGAVVAEPLQLHAAGERLLQLRVGLLHEIDDLHGVRLAFLHDLHEDGGPSVVGGLGLDALRAVVEGGDVTEVDALAAHGADLDVAEALELVRLAVEGERVLAAPVGDLSDGDLDILLADGLGDLVEGERAGGELLAVHLDDHLALHAADQLHRGDAPEGREAAGELVVRIVVEVGDGLLAHERDGGDGARVHVELQHLRILHRLRQVGADERDLLAHVGRANVGVAPELEFEQHLADVVEARRRHVLDAVHLHDRVLDLLGDGGLDFVRRGAGIDDGDGDVGRVDGRHEVDAGLAERQHAEDPQPDQEGHHRDGALDGCLDEKHYLALTVSPSLTRRMPSATMSRPATASALTISTRPSYSAPRRTKMRETFESATE